MEASEALMDASDGDRDAPPHGTHATTRAMSRSQHRDPSSTAWLAPDHEETGSSRAASLRTQEELPSDRDSDYNEYAQSERERAPIPPNLYALKRQHRPDLWGFVRLVPKTSFAHLPVEELTSSHAAAAFCLKCRMTIPFQKAQHFVKQHMQKYHANTLREFAEKKKPAKRPRETQPNQSASSPESVRVIPELVALTESNPSLRDGALSASLEEYAEAKCFFHYLDTRCLLQRRDVPSVRTNEYLGGVIDFTGELMRLAVVKATSRDIQEVERYKVMVEAISGELIQFDFRNGPLRRKFDAIKYNLQKLEVPH
ncbi:hypothetical protein BBJ28_00014720 [Nothophytophthora sp. Chile5]|nr:hypothetical protein BBJ28_00014720 [Nothophytophthora sp. Chile5]